MLPLRLQALSSDDFNIHSAMEKIAISLAGHTNLGKTTLARTLLRTDIGTVDDRPHVTDVADGHMLARDELTEIILWDLPGFGDSIRLKKSLLRTGILAWLQSAFHRWADRPLWCSQKSLENAKEQADVVLYLVEAHADPAGSADVQAEMEVLSLINKPVLVLLNQTGLPQADRDEALAELWRKSLSSFPFVRDVLPLDGWMRCWVQEASLLECIAAVLPAPKKEHFERVTHIWKQTNHSRVFAKSIQILSATLSATAGDRVEVEKEPLADKARALATRRATPQMKRAQAVLVEHLVERSRNSMKQLLELHKLEGMPKERVDSLVDGLKASNPDAPPSLWALCGAIGSGVLGGLVADIHAGGMTFGGGAVAGGILGGLAGYALGQGYAKTKGEDGVVHVRWNEDFLRAEWEASLKRYLMVAHFGRGRGSWQDPPPSSWPARWHVLIENLTKASEREISTALGSADEAQIQVVLESALKKALATLYPGSKL
jgi:GTPase Era involved in 16S rRNA processing